MLGLTVVWGLRLAVHIGRRSIGKGEDPRYAELLAKATRAKALDEAVNAEDRERLLESLKEWGALDNDYRYVKGAVSSEVRGYDVSPGGGLSARPVYSEPVQLSEVLVDHWVLLKVEPTNRWSVPIDFVIVNE